ncbi:hypothetical protein [Butyrivibrio sp. INlla16]|uniref:hypothetical protein n=1 Tax=Butyrivibrio sp. INlla16 TaxID=1520807 RepID=UPI00088595B9|nr:hypothetical protein [Butyrivibrio sp. INlla16]SDB32682.1 hypothetical protein SAMN02910263_01579 [Butyrivibrio sp. INlla16]
MTLKKFTWIVVLILVAVISFTNVAPWAVKPENHTHTMEQTEEKINTVLTLSGGAAATAATLSLLPGDMCTPIAEQLAELAKYFLLILSALYLEKFLISISGYIAFSVFIPLACLVLCGVVIFGKKSWIAVAGKIALIGLIIYMIVPASVKLSDMVYQTQVSRVNETVEEYNELDIESDSEGGILDELTTLTSDTVDRVTKFLSGLLESLAVMIVTACVIPILVFVFLVLLVKMIFTSNVMTLDSGVIDLIAEKVSKKR